MSTGPLIVIVGETASGKSAMALELAQRFGGEIVAADSRTIYRGMDIGTAKPTRAEQELVPHHLIDIAAPDQAITVAEYKQLANKAIADITKRGKLPFLVGGTGLYVDAVIFDFSFAPKGDESVREELHGMSVEELQQRLREQGIPLPSNPRNPRHLVRQLETGGMPSQPRELRAHTLVFAPQVDREELSKRIERRVRAMFEAGLEGEVRNLVDRYGWNCRALQSIGYQEFLPYFEGRVSLAEVEAKIVRATRHFAKRQRTWFRRNQAIRYICNADDAVDSITSLLNK